MGVPRVTLFCLCLWYLFYLSVVIGVHVSPRNNSSELITLLFPVSVVLCQFGGIGVCSS